MLDRSTFTLPTPEDDSDRKLLADVEECGWHMLGIPADGEGPAFAYTVGLYYSWGHPEVILVGLDLEVMFEVLGVIADDVAAGKRYEDHQETDDVVEGYRVCFRQVDPAYYREYLGYAGWFYQGEDFPTLQCVWPDAKRRYPWHPDCPQAIRDRQPILARILVGP